MNIGFLPDGCFLTGIKRVQGAEKMSENRACRGSRFGFIMATAGFAIGLGSVWRFPCMVG